MENPNNRIIAAGRLEDDLVLSHEVMNEPFYTGTLAVKRLSGAADHLPVTIPGKLLAMHESLQDRLLLVSGQVRSYNKVIDGAGRLKRVIHIDLPCILPTAAIMLIMRAGSVMSVGFEKVYLMQNSVNLAYSEIISTYVYKVGMQDSDFSYSTAIGLFNSVVNLALLVVVNTITKKLGETSLF